MRKFESFCLGEIASLKHEVRLSDVEKFVELSGDDNKLHVNKDFAKYRSVDAAYKFAQLVRSSIRDAEEYGLDSSKHTGWGIVGYNDNCGAEYEYTLLENGEVECVEV
jgi:hypothetical protein